jgi:hypothetical protein
MQYPPISVEFDLRKSIRAASILEALHVFSEGFVGELVLVRQDEIRRDPRGIGNQLPAE